MRANRVLTAMIAASLLSMAPAARAGGASSANGAVAQALFDQAKKLMGAGKYGEACPKLEESLRLDEALGTILNLADCYEKQGRLASAWSRFLEAEGMARAGGHAAAEIVARDRASTLEPKLSHLVVDVTSPEATPGLEITRDGVPVGSAQWGLPLPVDAGAHEVTAAAPARKNWSTHVEVKAGAATQSVQVPPLEIAPPVSAAVTEPAPTLASSTAIREPIAPPQADSTRSSWNSGKTTALALGGLGVAGLGFGLVEWIQFRGKKSDAENVCPASGCVSPEQYADARTLKNDEKSPLTLSIIGSAVGTLSLAGAAILWFSSGGKSTETTSLRIVPIVGPRGVAIGTSGAW